MMKMVISNHQDRGGVCVCERCKGCVFHWLTLHMCHGELIKLRCNAEDEARDQHGGGQVSLQGANLLLCLCRAGHRGPHSINSCHSEEGADGAPPSHAKLNTFLTTHKADNYPG